MDRIFVPAHTGARASTLLVLLPCAYGTPQDFVRHGFVQAVQQRAWPADLLLLNAHAGYYTSQRIVPRLLHGVLHPARAQGYARIWLVGTSLGGYGALLLASAHARAADGVLALATFLGRRDLPAAIARAGGLRAWSGQHPGADAQDLALWRWLRWRALTPSAPQPALWLGWGEQDRFIASNRLIGATLPAEQVLTASGGHDWPTWQRLWARFLDSPVRHSLPP